LRELAPQVLGAIIRRFHDFSAAEDAVQEALLAAAVQWPRDALPENPRAWLIQVAARRMMDHIRQETARRRRETEAAQEADTVAPAFEIGSDPYQDDTLVLLFMCCHPALTVASAIALTLRAVGGRDRQSVSGTGGDDGAAHQPGQAKHPLLGRAVPDAYQ
jgi:predicted RNA polymerase sigma factor